MAGADFVKTSTGFGPSGATAHDVELMRLAVGPEMGVKASGGIRTLDDLKKMVAAGATRIGASASVKIVEATDWRSARGGHGLLMATAPAQIRRPLPGARRAARFSAGCRRRHVRDTGSRTHPGQRRLHRQGSRPVRSVRHSALQRTAAGLAIRYAIGHREEVVRSLLLPLGEGITGIAAATRQPILVDDVRSDPRYLPALDAVRSELAVPMLARGKLVGVIDLQSTRLNAYREQDRALARN